MKKIKVLEVTPTLVVGGAENVTKSLADGLNKKFDLTVLCFCDINRENWPKELKIILIKKKRHLDLNLILKIRRELLKIKPDIIHNHHLYSLIYLIPASLFLKTKIVQTIHIDLRYYSSPVFWRIITKLFKIVSVNLSPVLNKNFQSSKDNYNIPNGININNFLNARKKNIPKIILNIGRLEQAKNHSLLLKVFKIIHEWDKEFKLIIVGQGSLKNKILEEISDLKLNKSVKLIHKFAEPKPYYKEAGYYISTSRFEGMPLTVIEALASGLIVFSTNSGAVRDLIKNERSGYLFRSNDPASIAQEFIKKSSDKNNLREIKQSLTKVVRNFDLNIMVDRYAKLFIKIHND